MFWGGRRCPTPSNWSRSTSRRGRGIVGSPSPMQYREREVEGMDNQAAYGAFVAVPSFGDRLPATEIAPIRSRIPSLRSVFGYVPESELPSDRPTCVVGLSPRAAAEVERSELDRRNTDDPNDPTTHLTRSSMQPSADDLFDLRNRKRVEGGPRHNHSCGRSRPGICD